MPLLDKKSPLDDLNKMHDDLGLQYFESQRFWRNRAPFFNFKINRYFHLLRTRRLPFPAPKKYSQAPRFALALQPELLQVPFSTLLATRRTRRESRPGSRLDFSRFSTWISCGSGSQHLFANQTVEARRLSERITRTTAAPGGIYATELYFINFSLEEIPKGLFHFDPIRGEAELIREDASRELARSLLPGDQPISALENAAGLVIATCVFERLRAKYGTRYLRFACLEAGTAYQSLDFAACALDLMFYPQGSLYEKEVCDTLGIDGLSEGIMWGALVGP